MAIYDIMQYIKNDVVTIVNGMAASMGQFILTAGTKGKRYALPNAEVLMHQPSAGLGGSESDIRVQAERLVRSKELLARLIAEHSGQSVAQISADFDRDRWFTAAQAVEYGLVDRVIRTPADVLGGDGAKRQAPGF
jgi:ATP-dependent Clp protease protease subunit